MKRCAHCGQENDDAASSCTSCGRSEFAEPKVPVAPEALSKGKPWVGVLLSLLISGFGISRAGHPGQAVAWFLGLEIGWTFVALMFALEWIPFGVGLVAGAFWLAAELVMLYLSYRPG